MARLNDLPAPAESLEALKRRFVRQNREIARVNSLQSLRIQSLESELSHLLKENAALKEQVISLTQDAEKFTAGRAFHKDIDRCKERLAAKVSELNELVSELGMIPESFVKKTAHLGTAETSINMEGQRGEAGRKPIFWDESGRLPTILEDKHFPRRTLDPEELAAAQQQDLDSPIIGSPPIAHFDVDQSPLSFGKHHDSRDIENSTPFNSNNDEDCNLSDSPIDIHNEDASILEQSASPSKRVVSTLSGSKRKFSATEDEITFSPLPASKSTLDDDFQFTRAVDVSRTVDISRARRPRPPSVAVEVISEGINEAGKKQPQKRGPLAKRKALEPKTTNMASSSPKKAVAHHDKPGKPENNNPTKRHGDEENTRNSAPPKKVPQHPHDLTKKAKRATAITEITFEDKPAKPVSSSVILESVENNNNPRKQSFTASDANTANEPTTATDSALPGLSSRPSRRARGAISYAEPNLRDKMRRATNELVDAVAFEHAQRASALLEAGGTDPNNNSSTDDNTHPLIPELPKHMVTERKRRTLSASTNELRLHTPDAEAGTMAAPSPAAAASNPRRRSSANPTTAAHSRRHSSHPAVCDRARTGQQQSSTGQDMSEAGSGEDHPDGNDSNDSSLEDIFQQQPHKRGIATKTGSATGLSRPSGDDNSALATRSQRVSSRRRSTLL